MADPTLYNVENGRDLAKEINAIVNRDKGIANAAAPFVHTGYNSSNYIYTSKNVGSGGKVANWRTSADALLLQANDTGVTVGVGLGLPWLTQGSIPIVGTTGALTEDHANLFWNQTNHFLGIGTTSPSQQLHVALNARVDGDISIDNTTLNTLNNNVGVGTTNPLTPLHVVGAANVTDLIRAQGNTGSGMTGAGAEIQYNAAGNLGSVLAYDRSTTTYTKKMQIDGLNTLMCAAGTGQATAAATGFTVANLLTLNAGQILFPSTQNASSDPNTLDDYEEGTWTPSLGGTATYTTQTGTYTKIARTVYWRLSLTVNAIGTGSQTTISGLPFTPSVNTAGVVSAFDQIATAVVLLKCNVNTSGNIVFRGQAAATTSTNVLVNIFQNNATIQANGWYEV